MIQRQVIVIETHPFCTQCERRALLASKEEQEQLKRDHPQFEIRVASEQELLEMCGQFKMEES